MEKSCETCAKRATCKKPFGHIAGYCNTDYEPDQDAIDEAMVKRLYDLSADQHLGLAVKLKEDPEWCREHLGKDTNLVKRAFDAVLAARQAERLNVWKYYTSTRRWPEIKNSLEFKTACEIIVEAKRENVTPWRVISLKRAIRAYARRPAGPIMVQDNGDSAVTLERLPFDAGVAEDAVTAWFMENRYMELTPSPYDCTGQKFTEWFKLVCRTGSWWAYHAVAMDV